MLAEVSTPTTSTGSARCPFGHSAEPPKSLEDTLTLKVGDQSAVDFLSTQANFDPSDIKLAKDLLLRLDPALINLFLVDTVLAMSRMPKITADFGALVDRTRTVDGRFARTKEFFIEMIDKVGTPQALAAIHRVNIIHHHVGVSSSDPQFGYVLFCLTNRFIDSVRRFDNTPVSAEEERAWYNLWREVGRLMGASLPDDYRVFVEKNHALEDQLWQIPNPEAKHVAQKMITFGTRSVPPALQFLASRWLLALSDRRVVDSLGLPQPALVERVVIQGALKLLGVAKDLISVNQS